MNAVKLTLIWCAVIFCHGTAVAEEPKVLAERLVELNQLERSMRENGAAFAEGFKESLGKTFKQKEPDLTDEQLAELFKIMDDEIALALDELTGPITTILINFYTENFSSEELSALVEMHSSAVYQKQLSLMPTFMQEAAGLQADWQIGAQGRLSEQVRAWLKKRKKDGTD